MYPAIACGATGDVLFIGLFLGEGYPDAMAIAGTHWHGVCCLEVVLDDELGPTLFRRLALAAAELRASGQVDGCVSSFCSLAAYWQHPPDDREQMRALVQQAIEQAETGEWTSTHHTVPVTYNGSDLQRVAHHAGCSEQEVVDRHTASELVVAAVGFRPHFAYLWGMDASIATPRVASPRIDVPAGTVAIGGAQTAIYPSPSPGGWNLIGSTDASICPLLKVGDSVGFEAVR